MKKIILFASFFGILNSGCLHTENQISQKTNFIYKKTQHGIINSHKESDLIGKTKDEISKLLGPSILQSSIDDSCKYYISCSSEHLYFQVPTKIESLIYKICFDKSSKVKSVTIIKKQNKDINKNKFKKSLKKQESLSKGEIFKQIFESSDLKVK